MKPKIMPSVIMSTVLLLVAAQHAPAANLRQQVALFQRHVGKSPVALYRLPVA